MAEGEVPPAYDGYDTAEWIAESLANGTPVTLDALREHLSSLRNGGTDPAPPVAAGPYGLLDAGPLVGEWHLGRDARPWIEAVAASGERPTIARFVKHLASFGDVEPLVRWAAQQVGANEERAVRIAWCESKLNPAVIDPAGLHWGLWQIAIYVHDHRIRNLGFSRHDMLHAWPNTILMMEIYRDAGGWHPWPVCQWR